MHRLTVIVVAANGRSGLEQATVELADGTIPVRQMTLLAEPGELLAILGPSGSGKSTILRAIAGLDEVVEGRVLIDGEPATPVGTRDVSMVFQDTHLIPFLDAARNMSFPLDLAKVPREESRERVQREATRFGLGRLLRRKPDSLSPGESARVSLGRATVRAPKVFLLDEPFAHLDAGARLQMRQELRLVIRDTGITTFFVTHDQGDAMSISDRVAVIDGGRVLQVGTGRELYDAPANAVVADLIAPGRVALLPARLVVAGGMTGYRLGDRTLPTWTAPPAGLLGEHDRRVLIGLHPEDVHEVPLAEHGTVTGIVRATEPVGSSTTVTIEVDAQELYARFGGRSSVRPGDRVTVGIDAARAMVFDADTGMSLSTAARDRG